MYCVLISDKEWSVCVRQSSRKSPAHFSCEFTEAQVIIRRIPTWHQSRLAFRRWRRSPSPARRPGLAGSGERGGCSCARATRRRRRLWARSGRAGCRVGGAGGAAGTVECWSAVLLLIDQGEGQLLVHLDLLLLCGVWLRLLLGRAPVLAAAARTG